MITLALSLLTIAVAWLAYRPILSIGLLAVACGITFALKSIFAKKKETTEEK